MNQITRIIWFLLNLFFGASLAFVLLFWIACDLQMPLILTNFISIYVPVLNCLFDVPYAKVNTLSSTIIGKLLFNALLYAQFGFFHTLFAQEFVQNILNKFLFPKQTLRTVYCIITTINVFIMIGFWQHTNVQLWNFLPSTMSKYDQQLILLIIFLILLTPGLYVLHKFDLFKFYGMQQIFDKTENGSCPNSSSNKLQQRTAGNQALVTSGLFGLCRHPLYLSMILAFSITPVMSLDHLSIFVYTLLYIIIGIPIEERKLVETFGQSYIRYRKHVPALIPFLSGKSQVQ